MIRSVGYNMLIKRTEVVSSSYKTNDFDVHLNNLFNFDKDFVSIDSPQAVNVNGTKIRKCDDCFRRGILPQFIDEDIDLDMLNRTMSYMTEQFMIHNSYWYDEITFEVTMVDSHWFVVTVVVSAGHENK